MAGTATGNAIQSASGGAVLANPVTVAQGGTGQTTANAGFNALSPLTTAGDLIIENATPVAARLPVGTAGQVLGVSSGLPAWGAGMTLLASTGLTGYVLVNGTGTVTGMSWASPNDGALHRVKIIIYLVVTSNETGGNINLNFTDSSNVSRVFGLSLSGKTTGTYGNGQAQWESIFVYPNTTTTLTQSTALTVGAATLWAEFWGS